jgi:hypothetical protein
MTMETSHGTPSPSYDNRVPRVGLAVPNIDVPDDPLPSRPSSGAATAERRGGVGTRAAGCGPTRHLPRPGLPRLIYSTIEHTKKKDVEKRGRG